ncbi:MAG: enoyl-CoA hydratase [Rhodobacteraceae bacterium]|nr:enoyl-CoA hydratase [Paracoccaceae bacterium]
MADLIKTERDGAVMTLRFNRPEKKNAITAAMYAALAEGLRKADADPGVKIVVLTGAGDAFTAGNDLKDFAEFPPKNSAAPVFQFMYALAEFQKPVIAAINGAAVGIGTTLLLHVDVAVAVESATFSMPFINLALVPEFASSLLLPRFVGPRKAQELLMSGQAFDAETAWELGLVGSVVEDGELGKSVKKMCAALLAKPPEALRATKSLLRADISEIKAAIAAEAKVFAQRLESPEFKEAATAFFQKRAPDFSKFN